MLGVTSAACKRRVSLRLCFDNLVVSCPMQRKVKACEVIEQSHNKSDTEEKDFFSVFYYDDYEVTKDDQQIHLQQKVHKLCHSHYVN